MKKDWKLYSGHWDVAFSRSEVILVIIMAVVASMPACLVAWSIFTE